MQQNKKKLNEETLVEGRNEISFIVQNVNEKRSTLIKPEEWMNEWKNPGRRNYAILGYSILGILLCGSISKQSCWLKNKMGKKVRKKARRKANE